MQSEESSIVVVGFARGGTNLISNILQSHPAIVSVRGEINETLGERSGFSRLDRWRMRNIDSGWIPGRRKLIAQVRQRMDQRKLLNLDHEGYKFSHEGRLYEKNEVQNAVTLYKGVIYISFYDLAYFEFIREMYGNTKLIFISRDGMALCEGWMRRGISAKRCGEVYQRCFNDLQRFAKSGTAFQLVKFEDVLTDPFGTSERLFSWLGQQPVTLEKLRLNIKKTLNQEGEHVTRLGKERQLIWLDRSNIFQLLDKDVNTTQADKLKVSDKEAFMKQAGAAMKGFGYI